jgi:hypothetical protein
MSDSGDFDDFEDYTSAPIESNFITDIKTASADHHTLPIVMTESTESLSSIHAAPITTTQLKEWIVCSFHVFII